MRLFLLILYSILQETISTEEILESVGIFKTEVILDNLKTIPGIQKPHDSYDFIIIGAGTAGCVLAKRLSEDSDKKILLVEAGGEESLLMDIPGYAPKLQKTNVDWMYKTVPSNTSCLGTKTMTCDFNRGKVMGGSSTLNYMIYTRGHQEDYNEWERLGNSGWSWKNVKQYFEKAENFHISNITSKIKGPLDINQSKYRSKTARKWIQAAGEAGIKLGNYNNPNQMTADFLHLTQTNAMRKSSNRAFLRGNKMLLKNLSIFKKAMAVKILFNKNKKAKYVEIVKNGIKYKVKARKEIILSAGAINSPQLLMLSGIGPKSHLEDLGIPVLSDLAVGKNLMDHISVPVQFEVDENEEFFDLKKVYSQRNLIDYVTRKEGILTTAAGCEALAFIRTNETEDIRPDIELLFGLFSFYGNNVEDYNQTVLRNTFRGKKSRNYFTIFPILMRPKSKGWLLLNNTDPFDHPLIYPNYLSDESDLKTIISGIREAIKISQQPAMMEIGAKLFEDTKSPCASQFQFNDDDYWECMIRYFTKTIYHLSGTCKMGPDSDVNAVVDDQLRVKGVKGLRVVDASIIPKIITGHTNAPVYMIAEKAADMIKNSNK